MKDDTEEKDNYRKMKDNYMNSQKLGYADQNASGETTLSKPRAYPYLRCGLHAEDFQIIDVHSGNICFTNNSKIACRYGSALKMKIEKYLITKIGNLDHRNSPCQKWI